MSVLAFIEDEVKKLDDMIEVATQNMALLYERRSALISAAVTGQIDVRGLAPAQGQAA